MTKTLTKADKQRLLVKVVSESRKRPGHVEAVGIWWNDATKQNETRTFHGPKKFIQSRAEGWVRDRKKEQSRGRKNRKNK